MQMHVLCRPQPLSGLVHFHRCLSTSSSRQVVASSRKSTGSQHANQPHITIVGGGAAGLTAAIFAAESGCRVTVLERKAECGKKILMSGGTRCNVIPMEVDVARDFFSESPASAVRAVLASWPLTSCRAWLEDAEHGLGLELADDEETMKVFPASNSSRDVRDALVAAAMRRGVTIKYNASVEGLKPAGPLPSPAPSSSHPSPAASQAPAVGGSCDQQPCSADPSVAALGSQPGAVAADGGVTASGPTASTSTRGTKQGKGCVAEGPSPGWLCRLQDGSVHRTDRVVLCSGGLSFPAVGTDGTGHRILQQLGHTLHPTYPALTPLTGPHPGGHQLAGLSLYAVDMSIQAPGVKKARRAMRSGLLFTHKGYSGPSVLDLSHTAVMAVTRGGGGGKAGGARPVLRVNWTGDSAETWEQRLTAGGSAHVATVLYRCGVRERLADALCAELGLERRKLSELRKGERVALTQALTAYELPWAGHEGYKKAEVTGGGVPLTQVELAGLESRVLPGVHLAGEILDCFGRIGGFNFLWAWVTGRAAGVGAAKAAHRQAAEAEARAEEVAAAVATTPS